MRRRVERKTGIEAFAHIASEINSVNCQLRRTDTVRRGRERNSDADRSEIRNDAAFAAGEFQFSLGYTHRMHPFGNRTRAVLVENELGVGSAAILVEGVKIHLLACRSIDRKRFRAILDDESVFVRKLLERHRRVRAVDDVGVGGLAVLHHRNVKYHLAALRMAESQRPGAHANAVQRKSSERPVRRNESDAVAQLQSAAGRKRSGKRETPGAGFHQATVQDLSGQRQRRARRNRHFRDSRQFKRNVHGLRSSLDGNFRAAPLSGDCQRSIAGKHMVASFKTKRACRVAGGYRNFLPRRRAVKNCDIVRGRRFCALPVPRRRPCAGACPTRFAGDGRIGRNLKTHGRNAGIFIDRQKAIRMITGRNRIFAPCVREHFARRFGERAAHRQKRLRARRQRSPPDPEIPYVKISVYRDGIAGIKLQHGVIDRQRTDRERLRASGERQHRAVRDRHVRRGIAIDKKLHLSSADRRFRNRPPGAAEGKRTFSVLDEQSRFVGFIHGRNGNGDVTTVGIENKSLVSDLDAGNIAYKIIAALPGDESAAVAGENRIAGDDRLIAENARHLADATLKPDLVGSLVVVGAALLKLETVVSRSLERAAFLDEERFFACRRRRARKPDPAYLDRTGIQDETAVAAKIADPYAIAALHDQFAAIHHDFTVGCRTDVHIRIRCIINAI